MKLLLSTTSTTALLFIAMSTSYANPTFLHDFKFDQMPVTLSNFGDGNIHGNSGVKKKIITGALRKAAGPTIGAILGAKIGKVVAGGTIGTAIGLILTPTLLGDSTTQESKDARKAAEARRRSE